VTRPQSGDSFLLCRVGSCVCAIPLARVSETLRPVRVDTLAGVPSFVLGVATIRGYPTPIIDAARLLGFEGDRVTRLVTIKIRDRLAAIAVDEVLGVRTIPADSLAGVPPLLRDASPAIVATVLSLDAELMLVLEASRVVPESVWHSLEPASAR